MGNTITGKPADEFSLWSTRLRIPTGWKQTSWLFTRVTEELYTGRPSDQDRTWIHGLRITIPVAAHPRCLLVYLIKNNKQLLLMYYYAEFDQEVRAFLPVQKSGCSRFQGHLLTRQFRQGFTMLFLTRAGRLREWCGHKKSIDCINEINYTAL